MSEPDSLAIIGDCSRPMGCTTRFAWGATLSEDFIYEEVGSQRRTEGREAFVEMWNGWRTVFPDVRGTIEHGFVSGDQAVAETLWNGTFRGDLVVGGQTFAATGRQMENFPVAFVCSVAGHRLTHMRAYYDVGMLLQQIGAKG